MDDEFGNFNVSLTKEIENNRLLELTVAELRHVATKFISGLEGNKEDKVSRNEVIKLRKSVSSLCPTYGSQLSLCYERIYQTYYRQRVLPCVENKQGEHLLVELNHRWNNHKKIVSYLAVFLGDLAKSVAQPSWTSEEVPRSLHCHVLLNRKRDGRYAGTLEHLAIASFRDQLLLEIVSEATSSVMKMVTEEREGVKIDQALLKSVCDIYVQSGLGTLEIYERDLERSFLYDTESYYSAKALSWIMEDSFSEYLLKLEDSLKKEKERVAHYLHSSTEPKLVEVVQNELLVSVENQLLKKERSGCRSFLRKNKKDNLSRMFRLYHAFPKRLEPFADVFRLHITTKMNAFIRQAENGGRVKGKVLVREIAGLHDKYMDYVGGCFQNHSLFHKAFEEAFVIFCNKTVGGRSIAERLATFCDNLLNKVGDNKMNDLSMVYKIYHTVSLPLEPVAKVFSSYVTTEVKAIIHQGEDAAATGSLDGQVLVREIIDLHVKHMDYVGVLFQNHSLFHNALKDAFKIFCDEEVAGSPSAVLLATYCEKILNKAEGDDKMDDISTMFRLYHAISKGLEPVAKAFRLHVTAQGNALIKQVDDALTNGGRVEEQALVRDLIGLHDKYMVYVKDWFHKLPLYLFNKAFKEAFETFCNKEVGKISIAELLATFCDNLLKKAGNDKSNDDSTIESTTDTVVELLDHISDRDLFAEFYIKKQARRLLLHPSVSDEHERSILIKLKGRFGANFTYKMEGMVTDMALAKEGRKGFTEYIENGNGDMPKGVDFTVSVLRAGFWPSFTTSEVNLPAEMAHCIGMFKAYYGTITKDRRLTWIYGRGTCHINGSFDSQPIELIVTTFQAVVLCAFNNTERLTYQELIEQLNLSHEDLVKVLHSLSCSKYKILKKEPASKTISETDAFEFNSKFTDKRQRIRVPLPSLPPGDERKKVVEDLNKDRRFVIDACLVRIMKSRRVSPYQQLISECVEQLSRKFQPDVKMIKKRIEDLICRDYLERDAQDPNTFKYVA